MSSNLPKSEEAADHGLLVRLSHGARMINLIHHALQSTLDADTLCWIVVATLVSRRGMGFSRGILLRHDQAEDSYRGCAAFGALDLSSHNDLLRTIEEEETLDRAIMEPEGLELHWMEEEALFQPATQERNQAAFWPRLIEKFRHGNELFDLVQAVSLSNGDFLRETDGGGRRFMRKLMNTKSATLVNRSEIDRALLPARLKQVLSGDSLWSVIRTPKGAQLILIADKAFEGEPIDEIDILHLDWFCGQVAAAIEKAELFSDLLETNESLKVLDTLKTNFLSTISHELRSPLTAIMGFTRLIMAGQGGDLTPKQEDLIGRVLHHSEKLTNIINDLIEIAEIDSGVAVEVNLRPVDPLNILMATLPKLEPRRASKSAEIKPVILTTVPLVRADEKRLGRILYHLIDNALKFSRRPTEVLVAFEVRKGELAIKIIDHGIGIAPEKLSKIFESFYQVDNQAKRVYEGMGIGLTLTTKLVAGTGGRLSVESQPGRGTTFTITYPLVEREPAE